MTTCPFPSVLDHPPGPSPDTSDDFFASVFHACALAAFVEVWAETGQFPPPMPAVRRRANWYYEAELSAAGQRHHWPLLAVGTFTAY